jgi:predicted RecB family nuclease
VAFSLTERAELLAVRGVGPTVVLRLEQAGVTSLAALARCTAADLSIAIAAALGSSCWRNSPMARAALEAAIAMAVERSKGNRTAASPARA